MADSAGEPLSARVDHQTLLGLETFTRRDPIAVDKDSSQEPYLSFTIGPRPLTRLAIEIWSNDQGWCDPSYKVEDPYTNSHTWFALGIIPEDSGPLSSNTPDELHLYEIQRNVRASFKVEHHNLEWNLNMPFEGEDVVQGWLESLSGTPGVRVGLFPLARYQGWVNFVYQAIVRLYHDTTTDISSHPSESPVSTCILGKGKAREVGVTQQAVEVSLHDQLKLAERWNDIGVDFAKRFQQTNAMKNLVAGEYAMEQSIKSSSQHPKVALHLHNLGNILQQRFQVTGSIGHLSRAIQAAQQAVEAAPQNHQMFVLYLNTLGYRLYRRHQETGSMDDLASAIDATEQSAALIPQHLPFFAQCLSRLGNLLTRRSQLTGSMNDLARAINALDQALKVIHKGRPEFPMCSNNLAVCLGIRFGPLGSMNDIARAIHIAEQAIEATPKADTNLPALLNTLGVLLRDRSRRTGSMDDQARAIDIIQQAIRLTPEENHIYLHTLANLLDDRFVKTRSVDDLTMAIQVAERAVKSSPQHHQNLSRHLNRLSTLLFRRSELQKGSMDDLALAIQMAEQSIEASDQDNPQLAGMLGNLGNLLGKRFERMRLMDDCKSQLSAYRRGWQCVGSPVSVRIGLAKSAAVVYASQSDWKNANELLQEAVLLLPKVGSRAIHQTDMQYLLMFKSGLASTAAAIALLAGEDPSHILPILEFGREIIAGLLIDMRQDLSDLKQAHPILADKFVALRDELDSPQDVAYALGAPGMSTQNRRHQASEEFENLVEEIREKSGFHDFLLPSSPETLIAAAKSNPIVVINTSDYRCDAFLVERGGIRLLELPDLTLDEVMNWVTHIEGLKNDPQPLLSWLWNVICRPCLEALGFTEAVGDNDWPHIWWVPTGPLSQLPLHAAGIHTQDSTETVLDRVVSSYASSIKTLQHGRQHYIKNASEDSVKNTAVLISMQDTPGLEGKSLPHASKDVDELQGLIPALDMVPVTPTPRKNDVLKQLRTCKVFHFAGHGESKSDPCQSLVLLDDWKTDPLAVTDLHNNWARGNHPFLAYLSACSTEANQAINLLDEGIHLVSAFQLAGFRHVVGTLWEVSDEYCADVAKVLYETLRDDGMTDMAVSRGLHKALRRLRDGVIRNGDKKEVSDYGEDEERMMDDEEGNGGVGDRKKRNVEMAGDESPGLMNTHWIPYIHFGV